MTNHWNDVANSDCILMVGCNPAENHPIGFRWVMKAQEKGAKLIVVDPRFTRSAAKADLHVRLRPGTDIALFNALSNYVLQNELFHRDYIVAYSNAGYVIKAGYGFQDGLFSGYRPNERNYKNVSWDYDRDSEGKPVIDPTLEHPRCVFQIVKAAFSRYTPEMMESVTGVPRSRFQKMAELYGATGHRSRAGTIMYAMGGTQHTTGVQAIRSYSILQILLGNMGIPGGGINALRGENNVQGSTDMGVLFHMLPGYMTIPREARHPTLEGYNEKATADTSFWKNKSRFSISLLKAFWGEAAKPENEFAYHYLPKAGAGHEKAGYSWMSIFEAMGAGTIKGMLTWGMNPAVSSTNLNHTYAALDKLEWMAVFDLWETETARFWKRPGADPGKIRTEVFLFPAADALEKEGSVTNSSRWIQWRYQAVKPHGDVKSDLWYLNRLAIELKGLYGEDPKAVFPKPITQLAWSYGTDDPDPHMVAKEINGYTVADRRQVPNFLSLKDDGSTACGCWLYSGFYPGPEKKDNKAASRETKDPGGLGLYPGWAFAWPVNRRIIYNRCSADPQGRPWNPDKLLMGWDTRTRKWTRHDVPDFKWIDPAAGIEVDPEESAQTPFIMLSEGKCRLFVPRGGCKDGPLPEHYEAFEGPFRNQMSTQQSNPVTWLFNSELTKHAEPGDPRYPLIATTFRVTEHWQSGAMTRNLMWQTEMVPEMYVEISPSLAQERRIKAGDWVKVVSPRGEVRARARVTHRVGPFTCGPAGERSTVEMVALPWHFGFSGRSTGGPEERNYAANQLVPMIGDANTMIPEFKVFVCDIRKV
jgi:formate dehydrogenase major subunit